MASNAMLMISPRFDSFRWAYSVSIGGKSP
jgi:hypothetical protein